MTKKNLINIHHSRSENQRGVMEQIAKDAVCPFCPEHLRKYHKEPTLKEGNFWILSKNQWPYANTKHQFIAIHKSHIEHLTELTTEATKELFDLFQWAAKEHNMPGGAVIIRFGSNPKHGDYGSSVLHLHAHLVEADLENPDGEPVRFKVGQPHKK
jgi:diadenosine tetraphosphate (Ap4A) HIT family hydrolase